jgi:N-acetylglucosaminyldiphosphoundecaprenol N-acetyl-beta-D-mannosaminyltransferase
MSEALLATERPYRRTRRPEERVRVLGFEMDLIRPEEVMHHVAHRLAAGEQTIVANHNLHSLYLCKHDAELREFYRIGHLIEADSTPLLWWARLIGRSARRFHRCTYLDWRNLFWGEAARRGWRVFYLGGAPGVAESAAERLRTEWGVTIATRDGYFDMTCGSADETSVQREIKAFKPDILFVGMGMPRQEVWVVRNHAALGPCAIFSVGAAFDYEADVQKAAPRWMGKCGVEWLFRLIADPRRLFRRYCVEPWHLVGPALADLARLMRR